jgi:hypothetical protein
MVPFLVLALPSGIAYMLVLVLSRKCQVAGCVLAIVITCCLLASVAVFLGPGLARTSPPDEGSVGFAYGFAASVVLGLYAFVRLVLRLIGRLRLSGRALNPDVERTSDD